MIHRLILIINLYSRYINTNRAMKKIFLIFLLLYTSITQASETNMQTVNVYLAYGHSSGPERIFRVLEQYGKKKNINFVPVIKPGGDGTIGVNTFLDEPATGNSILLTVISDISRPNAIKKFKESDLYPVSAVANTAVFVVAHPSVPVNNLKELQTILRTQPDRFTWGVISKGFENHIINFTQHSGGDPSRLIITKFNTNKGLNSTTALMGGHIDLAMSAARVVAESAQQNKVKILGIVKSFPGYENYQSFNDMFGSAWSTDDGFGVFINSKSSNAVKEYWNKFMEEFKNDPEVQRMFTQEFFIRTIDPDKSILRGVLDKNRTLPAVQTKMSELTGRQIEVATLISHRGLSNKQIARELGIGESAVKVHVGSMLKKYGLRDRTQLSNYFRSDLISG